MASAPREPLTLRGKLTALTDQILRLFNVPALVQPGQSSPRAPP